MSEEDDRTRELHLSETELEHRNCGAPNFFDKHGQLYLMRCYECGGARGRENWGAAVGSGTCAWCGWPEVKLTPEQVDALAGTGEHGGGPGKFRGEK